VLRSGGDATGAVLARQAGAGIVLVLAVASHEVERTRARVVGHQVHAGGAVAAQIRQAVVVVHFATASCSYKSPPPPNCLLIF
jgi:hypothetical protein